MPSRTENIKDNLVVQIKKMYRECNEKSFETRARYRDDYIVAQNKKGGVERQIKSIQNWLSNHNHKFIDTDRTENVRKRSPCNEKGQRTVRVLQGGRYQDI